MATPDPEMLDPGASLGVLNRAAGKRLGERHQAYGSN